MAFSYSLNWLHNIDINGIRHAFKNHGVGGKKLQDNSIPLSEENLTLAPYIMVSPDYVKTGANDNSLESVKYYKTLENGIVVVVEKENSADGLGTITMWASLSNVAYDKLKRPSNLSHVNTSENVTISDSDISKIHKGAENTIRKDVALKGADVFIEEWGGKATKMKRPDSKTANKKKLNEDTVVADKVRLVESTVTEMSEKLNTKIHVVREEDEAQFSERIQRGLRRGGKGWFDPKTGEVYVSVRNAVDAADVVKTVLTKILHDPSFANLTSAQENKRFPIFALLPIFKFLGNKSFHK